LTLAINRRDRPFADLQPGRRRQPAGRRTSFRERIKAADAVLFVTPEHNRSVPAALKNALDIGSRPYGKSAWSGKPAAVVSASPGGIGGFGANHHLRLLPACG
jgi:chromate reductase, NAD(P)H dehydrogenase (quinone)